MRRTGGFVSVRMISLLFITLASTNALAYSADCNATSSCPGAPTVAHQSGGTSDTFNSNIASLAEAIAGSSTPDPTSYVLPDTASLNSTSFDSNAGANSYVTPSNDGDVTF